MLADLQDRCSEGERAGKRAVRDLYGDDCNNALDRSFDDDVKRMQRRCVYVMFILAYAIYCIDIVCIYMILPLVRLATSNMCSSLLSLLS